MTNDRTILITGATGNQGGAVAEALRGSGFKLRGLTRRPDSEGAEALARHGVDIVKGDLDDEATLRRALAGAWGVFGVQNAQQAGVEREEEQGKRLAAFGNCFWPTSAVCFGPPSELTVLRLGRKAGLA